MSPKATKAKSQLKIGFKDVESFIDEYAYNISKGGIFFRTTAKYNLREVVEIILAIPEEQGEVLALGEVVQVVPVEMSTEQSPAGVGIHILDLKEDDLEKIEKFVNSKLKHEAGPVVRRGNMRIQARLPVKFESRDKLIEEYANNISRGGIFVATSELKQIGEQITMILMHPDNQQELLLKGVVVHLVNEEDTKRFKIPMGMGIRFIDLDPYVASQIDEFIKSETTRTAGKDLIIEETQEA